MFRMDSRVNLNNIQLSTRIAIVSPIFQPRVVFGRRQISGKARGPTLQSAKIINDFRKYHLILRSPGRGREDASRNSPQCLHFIASSWISSAQKGHFFIFYPFSIHLYCADAKHNGCRGLSKSHHISLPMSTLHVPLLHSVASEKSICKTPGKVGQ